MIMHSSASSVAGVKETQSGHVDAQWIMVIVVNNPVVLAKLCRLLACWKLDQLCNVCTELAEKEPKWN